MLRTSTAMGVPSVTPSSTPAGRGVREEGWREGRGGRLLSYLGNARPFAPISKGKVCYYCGAGSGRRPSSAPDRISATSASLRGVVMRDWPGLRRFSSA